MEKEEFNSLDEYSKKLDQLIINCLESQEIAGIRKKYYHDILNSDGRPDYKTIEILCIMNDIGMYDNKGFCRYNGYKIKRSSLYDFFIHLGPLIELGSSLNIKPQCSHCFEKLDIDLIFKHYQKFKND